MTTTTTTSRTTSPSSSSDTNPTGNPTTGNGSTLEVNDSSSSSKRELLYLLQQEHDNDTKSFSLQSNHHDNDNDDGDVDEKGEGEDDRLGTNHGNSNSNSSSSSSSSETPQRNALLTSWKNSDSTIPSTTTNPTRQTRPDPPSSMMMHQVPELEATSNQTATIQTTTTTTATTTSTTEEQEDLIVAQARALALNAEKQLAKQKKSKATGLNMLMIHHHHSDRDSLPLGDLEQRKLIEAKLGQKKSNNKLDPLLTSMKPLAGLADVRNKFEGFFQEQQQKLEESLSSHFDHVGRMGHSPPNHHHHHHHKTTGSHNHSGSGGSSTMGGSGSRGGSANPSPIHHPPAKVKHPHNQEREHDGHQDDGLQSVVSCLDGTTCTGQRVQHCSTTTNNTNSTTSRALNASSASASPSPTLSSIVYKRRSGYGKYSTKNAWERRRMDLVGTTLRYFADVTVLLDPHDNKGTTATASTTTARPSSEATVDHLDLGANVSRINDDDNGNVLLSSAPSREDNMSSVGVTVSSKPKKDIRFLWEQAKENITKTTETLATSLSQNSYQNLDPNAPRGSIDLIKENAIVAAMSVTRSGVDSYLNSSNSISISNNSSNHTPTPFGICIVVKNEVKWKICFDTQREQMQWLAVLTEMIVQHNVNMYNEGLTLSRSRRGTTSTSSNSGRGRLNQTITGSSGISAPHSGDDRETVDNNNETSRDTEATNTTDEIFHGPPGGNEHDLWQLDQKYSLTSLFNISKSTNPTATGATTVESREKEDAAQIDVKDNVGVNWQRKSISKSPFHAIYQVINNGASSGPSISLTGNNVLIVSCIFNIFIKIVHSLESGWSFWFSVLLSNVFFWMLIVDDSIRGEGQERISFLTSFFESPLRKSEDNSFSHEPASRDEQSVTKTIDDVTKKVPMPVIKGFKPIAGSTTIRVKDESESTTVNGENFISWCVLPPYDVQVRSHGYLKTKKKVPSASALYEIIGCDILNSAMRLENISTLVKLPHMEFDDCAREKTWNSPDVFAVSLTVPTEEPSMTRPSTDGEGLSVTVYYKMKKETRDILRKITGSGNESLNNEINVDIERSVVNAVKLWENWCTNAPHDEKMQARFKFIPNVHNPKEVGLPSYITKYCGKPVLIKRANVTGFLSTNPDINAMEFGISLHPFPYLAKKAMAYLKSTAFPKAIVSLSYVIEGRSDSELPEVLIGDALKLFYPNPELACNSDEFLAGAAKSSAATQIENKFESTEDS